MVIEKPQVSAFGKLFSIAFMKVMFKPVLGYRQDEPEDAECQQILGVDNSKLEIAMFQPPTDKPRGIVLLCHPFIKYGMHYFVNNGLENDLLLMGYRVVLFNFKGFGRSTVKGHAFSEDVVSVAEYIKQRYPQEPVFLIGCSFGGYHASHALPYHEDLFKAIILDSVPITVRRYFKKGLLAKAMHWISGSGLAEATGTCSIEGAIAKIKTTPVHFLYGADDRFVPQQDIDLLKDLCPEMHMQAFAGCRHLELVKNNRGEYLKVIERALAVPVT